METIVKKYVAKPKGKQSVDVISKIQQSIDLTRQQIDAVENEPDDVKFTNEKSAIKLKKTQLKMLQKRKEAIENQDRVSEKKFRKIDLGFLKRTKKQHVKGRLGGMNVEAIVKVPLYSCHKLTNYSQEYTFNGCELRLELTGGKITRFDAYSLSDNHPISEQYSSIYNTKALYLNPVRYYVAYMRDREFNTDLLETI